MKKLIIKDLAELEAFAREYATSLKGGRVIGLVGELGAGKTTFTQYLAKALGVKRPVKSPTFILMQAFETGPAAKKNGVVRLCHVDAYRLKDEVELQTIGFDEYSSDAATVCVVEWADRVSYLHGLPNYEEITLKADQEGVRHITLSH